MTKTEHIAEAERLAEQAAQEGSALGAPTLKAVLALAHAQIAAVK